MIHTIQLGVASEEALEFWAERLGPDARSFTDPDGLAARAASSPTRSPSARSTRRSRRSSRSPASSGARAYGQTGPHPVLTETLGFTADGDDFTLNGFRWGYDAPPAERGRLGAGTVHHIAWASRDEDHLAGSSACARGGPAGQRRA